MPELLCEEEQGGSEVILEMERADGRTDSTHQFRINAAAALPTTPPLTTRHCPRQGVSTRKLPGP